MSCPKPEDPAAVAAREKRNQRFAIAFGGALVGFGIFAFVRWMKETSAVVNQMGRRKPWDL